jgi:hypothetical protein
VGKPSFIPHYFTNVKQLTLECNPKHTIWEYFSIRRLF